MRARNLILFALLLVLAACNDKFLDREPTDSPSSSNFYTSEKDLVLAVNSAYRELNRDVSSGGGSNQFMHLDVAADNLWVRCGTEYRDFGNGTVDPSHGEAGNIWTVYYRGIGKCNTLLDNMEKAVDNTDPEVFARIAGEARFLRAYFYAQLLELYGDVPLVTSTLPAEEAYVTRTPMSEVLDFVLNELDAAAAVLPQSYEGADDGRATSGAALGIKARVTLLHGMFAEAAAAAEAVMASGEYELYPNYGELFTYTGENSNEVILNVGYARSVNQTNGTNQNYSSRFGNGWSCTVPTREAVDAYRCIDGLQIDESPLYDPSKPYQNRDPRLDMSIVHNGSVHFGWPYYVHPDSIDITNPSTGVRRLNLENSLYTGSGSPASNTGYVLKKYLNEEDVTNPTNCELDFMLMRYAEVLLTYAEAKIELNQIDQTVLDAMNLVRERAGMPLITTMDQNELRTLVRYERRIEFLGEGLRYFDVKRFDLGPQVLSGTMLARPKITWWNSPKVPDIDNEEGYATYSDIDIPANYDIMQERIYRPERNYLWPIPQSERDVNPNLTQNPGY